jgi:hypothetical protein
MQIHILCMKQRFFFNVMFSKIKENINLHWNQWKIDDTLKSLKEIKSWQDDDNFPL